MQNEQAPAREATLEEAKEALAAGDAAQAELLYRQLSAQTPQLMETALGLAEALHMQDRRREAMAVLTRSADAASRRGELTPAIELQTAALRLDESDAAVRSRLGQMLALDRRYLSAEKELQQARESGRRDLQTLLYLASCQWENGKLDQAEERYREAVERHGRSPLALHQLGRLLLWRSRFGEALELFSEARRRGVDGLDFELDRARALEGVAAGGEVDPQEAVVAYQRLSDRAPQHSEIRYGLARSLLRAGDLKAAEEELAVFRQLSEEDRQRTREQGQEAARLAAAETLLASGQAEAALERLQGLPASAASLRLSALSLRALGRSLEAAAALREAIALEPERQDLRSLLAEIEAGGD